MAARSGTSGIQKEFKVVVIGDSGVGKRSIVIRYCLDTFAKPCVTIGVSFESKCMEWNRTRVQLTVINCAGQMGYVQIVRPFLKATHGALVVIDVTNKDTLEAAAVWKKELDCNSTGSVPAILLANKCDLPMKDEDLVSTLDSFCKENGFLSWIETSAKENINIDEAFSRLVSQMMLCDSSSVDGKHQKKGIAPKK